MCVIRLFVFVLLHNVEITIVTTSKIFIFVIEFEIKVCVNELLHEKILKRLLILFENILTKILNINY